MNVAEIIFLAFIGAAGLAFAAFLIWLVVNRIRSGSDRNVLPEEYDARQAGERERATEGYAMPGFGKKRR
jgi:hypothetical protein